MSTVTSSLFHGRALASDAVPSRDQRNQQLPEILSCDRVDAGGGFIQQQDSRTRNERGCQPQLLSHTPGKLSRPPILEGSQTDKIEDLHAAWQPFACTHAADLREEPDILQDRQFLIQREALR